MKKLFRNLMLAIILIAASTRLNAQYWQLNGNNLSQGIEFLGTRSTSTFKDLIVKTNGGEAMRIKGTSGPDNHFVGIGMNTAMPNPLTRLHVHDGIIRITGQNTSGGPMIVFGGTATTAVSGEWGIEYTNFPTNNGLNFWKPFGSTNGGGNYFLYLSDNGNVGINTSTPAEKFEVFGGDARIHSLTVGLGAGFISTNTALGFSALATNTSGYNNTATGYHALFSNTIGWKNTATGYEALYSNLSGVGNTAYGYQSLRYNSIGIDNTATGYGSLFYNTGDNNTADGYAALFSNITGTNNAAFGMQALYLNQAGTDNTAIGYRALYNNIAGNYNTSSGFQSLYFTTGDYNTANGFNALFYNVAGTYNTALGYAAGVPSGSTNLTNATAIGANALVCSSNMMVFGDGAVTKWGFGTCPGSNAIQVGSNPTNGNGAYLTPGGVWTNAVSMRSKKEDITPMDKNDVLEKIMGMEITKWKIKGTENEYHIGPMVDEFYPRFKVGNDTTIADIDKTGVLFLGVQALGIKNKQISKSNAELISKAQTLEAENADLKSVNDAQQKQIDMLIASVFGSSSDGILSLKIATDEADSKPLIGQNIPNPFDNSTLIPFRIPVNCSDASIVIAESTTGKIVRAIPIACGETQLRLQSGTLVSGSYSYSLYVDGKMIDSKQMVIVK